jgi:hypothetical protein
MTSAFLKNLFTKCKMHGSGDAQVILADTELYALICIAIGDLGWSFQELGIESIELPNTDYYQISLSWFNQFDIAELSPDKILAALDSCIKKDNDFFLYIDNFSAEQQAGTVISKFIEKYIKPAIQDIESVNITDIQSLTLSWIDNKLMISNGQNSYTIDRFD